MSYPAPDTGNAMNDLFSRLSDFHQLAWHLTAAETLEEFHVWLDKLLLIDRRSTILYLEAHGSGIPGDRMKLAERLCAAGPLGGKHTESGKEGAAR